MALSGLINNSISFALASMLMLGGSSELNASYIQAQAYPHKHTQKQRINASYARLCNNIYEANFMLSLAFSKQGYLSEVSQKQTAKKHIKTLQKVITEAKKRMQKNHTHKEYDEKVFYSSVALKNILEEICNETFMRIVGKQEIDNDFNIVAYAKGVLRAENGA